MMEENVFYLPAVAGLLSDNYVEARLHADGEVNIERIRELQLELAQSVATPIYVVVDPKTGEKRALLEGATLTDTSKFTAFLESALTDS